MILTICSSLQCHVHLSKFYNVGSDQCLNGFHHYKQIETNENKNIAIEGKMELNFFILLHR